MTKVYVDNCGYLWTFRIIAMPHGFALIYECGDDSRYFIAPIYAYRFREMLGMELLGEL